MTIRHVQPGPLDLGVMLPDVVMGPATDYQDFWILNYCMGYYLFPPCFWNSLMNDLMSVQLRNRSALGCVHFIMGAIDVKDTCCPSH